MYDKALCLPDKNGIRYTPMIETLLFAVLAFVSIWLYFMALGVMNFKKDPNAMEDHLPGRPARRTIGRKNDDMAKSITYIFVGHAIFSACIYGLLDYKDFLFEMGIGFIAFGGLALSMFLFSPANRLAHAYVNLGQIAVIHFISALSAFLLLGLVLYRYTLSMDEAVSLAIMMVGAMMCFGKMKSAKKAKKEEDIF
jgi:uncharacterized protein (DUF486 family)